MSHHATDSSGNGASPPQVSDFDLVRLIGEGGFGQVWLARNRATGQLRAVKVIRASLHEAGMVHRDVKPANCLFVDGELKLADFGLLAEADPQMSRVGTWKYMPPDGRMDSRADVYAAGLVIYEMITGLPADSFPRPGERAPEAVEDPTLGALNRLALRACETDPQRRFPSAREMLAELEASKRQSEVRPARWRRRIIAPVTSKGVAGILIAFGLAAAGWWAVRPQRVHVNFVTYPFEATIYLDGTLQKDNHGNPYRTPCTIENLPPRVHHVEFQHDVHGRFDAGRPDFGKQRRIVKRWSPKP